MSEVTDPVDARPGSAGSVADPLESGEATALRRKIRVSGLALLVAHGLYTLFQVAPLVLSGVPSFVDSGVLGTSFAVNAGLDVAAVAFLVTVRRTGRRPGARVRIERLCLAFGLLVLGVWGVQAHFGGSQSSHLLALIIATLLVLAWVLPVRQVLVLSGVTTIGLVAVTWMEVVGVLPYSPLLPEVRELRHVFLDWRVLAVNAVIYACALGVSMVAMVSLRQDARRSRDDLETQVAQRTADLRRQNRELAALRRESEARSAALAESEARFRAVVLLTPDHVVVQDRDLRYQAVVNPQLGLTEEAMLGRTDRDLLEPADAEKLTSIKRAVLEDGRPARVEASLRNAQGLLEHFEGTYVAKRDAEGRTDGLVGYFRNVTERKATEEAQRRFEALGRHQQKLESIGTLASGVAHEINNPLMVILNFGQLIQDDPRATPESKDYADNIVRESERVADIVRNLLSFARQDDDAFEAVQPVELVERALSLARSVLLKDRITLECDLPADLPAITCRPRQIQQVLMNLVTNARDALNERWPGGGEDKRLRIGAVAMEKAGGRFVRMTVEDRGAGIPPEVAERVFDPFFTTKGRDRGTGLGLSISYGIVREHGGEIGFETAVGEGTRFHVDLPQA